MASSDLPLHQQQRPTKAKHGKDTFLYPEPQFPKSSPAKCTPEVLVHYSVSARPWESLVMGPFPCPCPANTPHSALVKGLVLSFQGLPHWYHFLPTVRIIIPNGANTMQMCGLESNPTLERGRGLHRCGKSHHPDSNCWTSSHPPLLSAFETTKYHLVSLRELRCLQGP